MHALRQQGLSCCLRFCLSRQQKQLRNQLLLQTYQQ
jgi:hypothetical protein